MCEISPWALPIINTAQDWAPGFNCDGYFNFSDSVVRASLNMLIFLVNDELNESVRS